MKYLSILVFLISLSNLACAQAEPKPPGQWLRDGEKVADSRERKAVGGFGAHLLVVKDPAEVFQQWMKPEKPNIQTIKVAKPSDVLGAIILFAGCLPDSEGICDATSDIALYRPDGESVGEKNQNPIWNEKAPPANFTHFGKGVLMIEMKQSDFVGEYKVKAKVYDNNAKVSFELETTFTFEKEQ